VRKRLTALKEGLDSVSELFENLPDSDGGLVSNCATIEFLADRPCVYERKVVNVINLYRSHVESALKRLNAFKQTGRMPGFAKQAFAVEIAKAYQIETGEFPTATRAHKKADGCALESGGGINLDKLVTVLAYTPGSKFYRILQLFLSTNSSALRSQHQDVEPLARHAVEFLRNPC